MIQQWGLFHKNSETTLRRTQRTLRRILDKGIEQKNSPLRSI